MRVDVGSWVALGLTVVVGVGWWDHNNSASARAQAAAAAADATAGAYEDDAESADCGDDCKGQDAGWAWARRRHIAASIGCPASTAPSFREGCQAYADTYNAAHDGALSDAGGD